ncbi:predicted protein [Naegleria gruberi]|uniref:Predicted protein n=1 Tax=Naegleria gruberi TaxID=5762 RepID=D2UX96_NAEGR|nr:uncharacterized protein NAEGRDRAFT_61685 [Naegleria gruberi]EFC50593.1 predicted protein [Naegleria gruberi]|eukprot:XP_002683337.1 predicted protein [Naegleria gruberi strain NEG-M]
MMQQQSTTTSQETITTPTTSDALSRDEIEYKQKEKQQQFDEEKSLTSPTSFTTTTSQQQQQKQTLDNKQQEINESNKTLNSKELSGPNKSNKSESLEHPMSIKEFLKITILPRWYSVPNKVSEARDMLATERTMLSWYRTAFSILGVGIAVSRMKKSDGSVIPKVVGAISCSLAMILIMYAHLRYYAVMKSLFEYHFSADTLSPPFILLIGLLICVIAVLLFFV